MATFKEGIGLLVAGTAVQVIPCHLSGCFEALPAGSKLPKRQMIEVRIGEPLRFGHVDNDKEGWRTVSEGLEAAVRQLGPISERRGVSPT